MALERYTDASVYVRNSLLTEAASLEIDRVTNAQNVLTLAKGFAGQSPGAKLMNVRISNAVKAAGFEYDPGDDMDELVPVPLQFFVADSTMTTTGFIERDTFKKAVNQEGMLDISVVCEFAKWQ